MALLTYRSTPILWCNFSTSELLMEDASALLYQRHRSSLHHLGQLSHPECSGSATPRQVTATADSPRSYIVTTPYGEVRRNRMHLNILPDQHPSTSQQNDSQQCHCPVTRSVTGTSLRPPERYYN